MDQQFREIITGIVTELHDGTLSIVKNTNHMTRVTIEDAPENGMRIFAHNGLLYIKSLTVKPVDVQVYIPDSVQQLHLEAQRSDIMLHAVALDKVSCKTMGDCSLHGVTIRRQCALLCEGSDISLQESLLRGVNIQLTKGTLETYGTTLTGNNMIFSDYSTIGGNLKGTLADYVVSAGSGITPEQIIVNERSLAEFPESVQRGDVAWLLIAGRLRDPVHFTIADA
jgi:hypothetical protein